jgi:hypothetical protein
MQGAGIRGQGSFRKVSVIRISVNLEFCEKQNHNCHIAAECLSSETIVLIPET